MGKFKEFLINEEVGLGELGPKIDDLFNSQLLGDQINGALTSMGTSSIQQNGNISGSFGNQSMARSNQVELPSTEISIPSVERTGRITTLLIKKNPIYVRLSDGTEANFTHDEYNRIQGEPALGKNMTLVFQRNPADASGQHSKINKAIVRD